MSAPPKPWEGVGINARSASFSFDSPSRFPIGAGGPKSNALRSCNPSAMDASNNSGSKPPPLPPRPQAQRSSGGYMYGGTGYGAGGSMYGGYSGMYGGGMGGYGMYGGGYGGYGSYGGYGIGMNRFGSPLNQLGTSSFVGQAEETSRAAFQSIESIVQAFGSVAMMLESTHFAMRNTFLAVLSMADHFRRLRAHLVSVLGAFTLFKAIRYVFRKIRALLGLTQNQVLEEELWKSATTAVVSSIEGGDSKKPRSWPILLFFAVVLGTPLIIWKLLQSLLNDESNVHDWKTGEGDHVIARGEYDFDGEGEEELSFRTGDILRLAPKGKQPRIRGWLLGTVDGITAGIVPANYVKILGLRRGKKESKDIKKESQEESQTPQTEQRRSSQTNMDQEFDKIIEKSDEDSLLPSQNLLNEDSLNERTLVDDDLSDSDLPNFNEGQT